MTIKIYKSALCPRCAYAISVLKDLQKEFDDIKILSYDIVTDFKVFKESDIRMIPTIQIKDDKQSWLLPRADSIREFILENR